MSLKLTDLQLAALEHEYRHGALSIEALADKLGQSKDWLYKFAERRGWKRPVTGAPRREWTEAELARMRRLVESGDLTFADIGRRFRASHKMISSLAQQHGWRNPHAERSAPKPVQERKVVRQAWSPGWQVVMHDPDDLCGGRRLAGDEFAARKAELEAREAAERART